MKKRVIILVVGFLFIGFNLFAADGDLIVNGKVGVGTTTPDSITEIQFTGGGGKIGLHVEDNGAGSDTLLKLDDPSGDIAGGSYFIRALDGTTNAFYIKGNGTGYLKGNLGLGVSLIRNLASISVRIIQTLQAELHTLIFTALRPIRVGRRPRKTSLESEHTSNQ